MCSLCGDPVASGDLCGPCADGTDALIRDLKKD